MRGMAIAIAGLALGLGVVGCSDGVGAELRGSSVRILLEGVPYEEQSVSVGTTVALDVEVRDANERVLSGVAVNWRSDRPEVAIVDAGGLVTTKGHGTVRIIARTAAGEDTARFTVAAYVAGDPECGFEGVSEIGPGEAIELVGAETVDICLPGGADRAEYTLIATNTGETAASVLGLNLRVNGFAESTAALPAAVPPMERVGTVENDPAFHRRIREEASRRLAPRLFDGASLETGGATIAAQASPGQLVSYNVAVRSGDGCGTPTLRAGRVRHVSSHAIVVSDTLNPARGFTDADYEAFAAFFDEEAWPLITGTFGTPSDIDGNGRVVIFFTRAVNELSQNSTLHPGSFVGGFFFNRDLFPKTGSRGCAGSNEAEMFYMLVPDPTGEVQGRAFSTAFVRQRIPNLLIHEFQHLVNDSRRLHVNASPVWEETWLNEAISHVAEELMFYRSSGTAPRQNLGPERLQEPGIVDAFSGFQLDNLDRLTIFLQAVESSGLAGQDLLATRGAGWSFLRYVADRGGDEGNLWDELVRTTRTSGFENLRRATGIATSELIGDWSVSLYADDVHTDIAPRFRQPSWNLRAIYPALGSLVTGRNGRPYPLRVVNAGSAGTTRLEVSGGTAGYVRLGVAAGEVGTLRFTVGPPGQEQQLPPPDRFRVTIVRTR